MQWMIRHKMKLHLITDKIVIYSKNELWIVNFSNEFFRVYNMHSFLEIQANKEIYKTTLLL